MNVRVARLFYYTGVLGAIVAIGLWIPAWFINKNLIPDVTKITAYPVNFHAEHVCALFIFPLFVSFIGRTALPVEHMKQGKYFLLLSCGLSLFPLSLLNDRLIFNIIFILLVIIMLIQIITRIKKHKHESPFFYRMTAAALFICAISLLISIWSILRMFNPFVSFSHTLLYYGFIPLLFVALPYGIMHIVRYDLIFPVISDGLLIGLLLLFLSTFVLESSFFVFWTINSRIITASIVRLVLLTLLIFPVFYFIGYLWSLWRSGAIVLIIALVFFLIGHMGIIFFPAERSHYAHFSFLATAELLLLLPIMFQSRLKIKGRVQGDIQKYCFISNKYGNYFLWVILILFFISIVTRGIAHLLSNHLYLSHIFYASIFFSLSLPFCIYVYYKKL